LKQICLRRVSVFSSALSLLLVFNFSYSAEIDTIPKLNGALTTDGKLHEPQWRDALRITYRQFSRWQPQADKLPDDEFVLRLFHDGSFLYVALASYDRYVESATQSVNADGLYALSLLGSDNRIHHFRLRWASAQADPSGEMLDIQWGARLRGPFNDLSYEGGGYVLEFAVPFTTLSWQSGDAVNINVLIQDHDNNPGGAYNAPDTRFVRFALGHFDSDESTGFYPLQLAQ